MQTHYRAIQLGNLSPILSEHFFCHVERFSVTTEDTYLMDYSYPEQRCHFGECLWVVFNIHIYMKKNMLIPTGASQKMMLPYVSL